MANTLLAIKGGATLDGQNGVEVYLDLDTASRTSPTFSVPAEARTVEDFFLASGGFLSSFALSGYTRDEEDRLVVEEIEDPPDGWAWVCLPEVSGALAEQGVLSAEFAPSSSTAAAGVVFSYISSGAPIGRDFTDGTVRALSSAVYASAFSYAAALDAEMYKWRYKVSKLVNVNAVKNSLRQIFTWLPGERIINPEFGSNLRKYLYEQITEENQERIVAEIRQCVLRWEPRVVVDRVVRTTTTDDVENNTVKLDIYYRIKGLND